MSLEFPMSVPCPFWCYVTRVSYALPFWMVENHPNKILVTFSIIVDEYGVLTFIELNVDHCFKFEKCASHNTSCINLDHAVNRNGI